MKRPQLLDLGIRPAALEDADLDVARLVVEEEFNRKTSVLRPSADYRSRAIDRLIKLRCPWSTERNITTFVMGRLLRVKCPYCDGTMAPREHSGCGDSATLEYACGCGASAGVTVPHDGVAFMPPKEPQP